MEDRLLVLRCKRGSKTALERIYQKYRSDLLILAVSLLNETSEAEDVIQDVFVVFVRNLDKFKLTGSLKGYLLTCVANRARNQIKSGKTHAARLEKMAEQTPDCEQLPDAVVCNEELGQLRDAMARLPYEQREVLMLRTQGNLTFECMASELGISTSTAKSRYRYGLDKLRSILNGQEK